ncbi:MAG: AAA family ATPase, partial [Dysgonomonas sp.]
KERYTTELSYLVSNIRSVVRKTGNKVFAIYSPVRREGKSLVSLQTALSLADRRMKVLLVDIDFFSPKLTRLFNKKAEMGLTDYFSEKCGIEDIIHTTENENLSFTAVGTLKMKDNLGYDEPFLSDFIDYAKENYDIVIFDTPALLYIPDIVNFMDKIEKVILIVHLGHTTRSSLDRMLNILHNYRAKITGVVLNDLKVNFIGKYSDYYHYEYYEKEEKSEEVSVQNNTESSFDEKPGFFYNLSHSKWTWALLGLVIIAVLGFFSMSFLPQFKLPSSFDNKKDIETIKPSTEPFHSPVADTSGIIVPADTISLIQSVSQPQAQAAVASEYIDTVKIEAGLRLTLISLKYYGQKQFWVYIYLANKDRIADPSNISVGTHIYIPRPEKYGIDPTNKKSLDEAAALQTKIINKEL